MESTSGLWRMRHHQPGSHRVRGASTLPPKRPDHLTPQFCAVVAVESKLLENFIMRARVSDSTVPYARAGKGANVSERSLAKAFSASERDACTP
jgi:hypothetical protein